MCVCLYVCVCTYVCLCVCVCVYTSISRTGCEPAIPFLRRANPARFLPSAATLLDWLTPSVECKLLCVK